MASEGTAALDQLFSELDRVKLGRVADVAAKEAIEQFGYDELEAVVQKILTLVAKDYNPPGPEFTDNAIRAILRNHAAPGFSWGLIRLLKEKYGD